MKVKGKDIVVNELMLNDDGNVVKKTYKIKKGQAIGFIQRDVNKGLCDFPFEDYEIHIGSGGSIFNTFDLDDKYKKKLSSGFYKALSSAYKNDNISNISKELNIPLIVGVSRGAEFRVYFINKKTNEKSYVIIQVSRTIPLLPIILFSSVPIIVAGGILLYNYSHRKPAKPDNPKGFVEINSKNKSDDSNNKVIYFPDNLGSIYVSISEPNYMFYNSAKNHVYFHYYIYDKENRETINIGQIEPTDDKALKIDLTKYFDVGEHEVRVDVKTFKDKDETIEKHPMSFACTLTVDSK